MTFHAGSIVLLLHPDAGVEAGTRGVVLWRREGERHAWDEQVWQVKWDKYTGIQVFGVYESWICLVDSSTTWFDIWGAP